MRMTLTGLLAIGIAACTPTPPPPPPPPPPPGQQVVTNYHGGMTIRTANAYGNIETRAMSYGPGFCTTHVSVGDKTVSIAAPPAVYTPWVTVRSHSGSLTFPVSKTDQCDTGTEVQIRYWK